MEMIKGVKCLTVCDNLLTIRRWYLFFDIVFFEAITFNWKNQQGAALRALKTGLTALRSVPLFGT
jgi:hypothetical protein